MRNVAVMVVGGLLLTSCGDAGSDNATLANEVPNLTALSEAANDSASPVDAEKTRGASAQFKLGDTMDFDAFQLTVKSVEQLTSVGYGNQKAADGGVFVAVTYRLKNTSQKPLKMFDRPTLQLVDGRGTVYSPDISATMLYSAEKEFDAKAASDLNPGITTTDGAVWEVSRNQFNRDTWKLVVEGHDNASVSLAQVGANAAH